jgi:plasmid maintenance system antidote protein VapI
MDLYDYVSKLKKDNPKLKHSDIAKTLNIHPTFLSYLMSGKAAPGFLQALKLEDITEGAVDFMSVMKWAYKHKETIKNNSKKNLEYQRKGRAKAQMEPTAT